MSSISDLVIGILFFEKVEQTIECIKSVIDSGYPIVVLNNNSTQNSLEKLQDFIKGHKQITLINSRVNLGPAKGRNLIINSTKEPWLLFLDNDITVETKNWGIKFKSHINDLSNENEVLIPRLYNVHENLWLHYHRFIYENGRISGCIEDSNYVNCFPGGASFVRRSVFDRLGLYDEHLDVLEDFEFSIRGLLSNDPLKCLLISDIYYHTHKKATNSIDQHIAKIRYSSGKYVNAEKRIIEKHKIHFDSGWNEWANAQLNIILGQDDYRKNSTIKQANPLLSIITKFKQLIR